MAIFRPGLALLVTASLVASPFQDFASGQEQDFRAAFLRDYEPHAAKLQELYANVFVRYTQKNDAGNGDVQVMDVEAKANAHNFLLKGTGSRFVNEKTNETKEFPDTGVDGLNPYYFFSVTPGPQNGYKLQKMGRREPKSIMPDNWFPFPYANTHRSQSYLDLARDGKVQITGYEDVVWENQNLKKLTYRYESYNFHLKKDAFFEVTCYFSPNDGWVCCGEEKEESQGLVMQRIYSYEKKGNNFPTPVQIDVKYGARLLWTITIHEFRAVPPFGDEEFRLSAFGLPEPMGVPPVDRHGIPWFMWLTLATVGVLGVSVTLVFFRKRYFRFEIPRETNTIAKEGGS
jgi:hypothetical protein